MNAYPHFENRHEIRLPTYVPFGPDPLEPDDWRDTPLQVTKRRLIRLAVVAADTGARFQRDGLEYDAIAWLTTPLALFGGADAIEATLGLVECRRAILLHGLQIGLDADPSFIDGLRRNKPTEGPWPLHV